MNTIQPSRGHPKLGKRLTALLQAVPKGYDDIWDLACDHGYLGQACLADHSAQIHFVDPLPHLMDQLAIRLRRSPYQHFTLHTQDAATLQLPKMGRQLLILAGVGDVLSRCIIEALNASTHDPQRLDWLLCPTHNLFEMRQFLQSQHFGLIKEGLVFERQRAYEWLLVSTNRHRADKPIENPAHFWRSSNPEHQKHLKKLLQHARNKSQNPLSNNPALKAYQQLLIVKDFS